MKKNKKKTVNNKKYNTTVLATFHKTMMNILVVQTNMAAKEECNWYINIALKATFVSKEP